MSLTTVIVVNAVLDVLVIVALFRVMWFGISKPYEEQSERCRRVPKPRVEKQPCARRPRARPACRLATPTPWIPVAALWAALSE